MLVHRFALVGVLALSLVAGIAQAGGRARVTILSAPMQAVAGQVIELAFAVNPEWPMAQNRAVEPTVKAVCGDRAVTCTAVALKESHRYKANLTLPQAGEWTITVDSRYCQTAMTPLVLKAQPAPEKRAS